MGRKSKLSDKQWEQIGARLLKGEKARALAREFEVSEAAIRARFSAQNAEIKTVANQIVATETALKALPISAQIAAQSLADDLRAISTHLAGAARYGAATAHRLQGIANAQVEKVDDAEPEKSIDALQRVGILTKLANDAGAMGFNLLSANKETMRDSGADLNKTLCDLIARMPG